MIESLVEKYNHPTITEEKQKQIAYQILDYYEKVLKEIKETEKHLERLEAIKEEIETNDRDVFFEVYFDERFRR